MPLIFIWKILKNKHLTKTLLCKKNVKKGFNGSIKVDKVKKGFNSKKKNLKLSILAWNSRLNYFILKTRLAFIKLK